MKRINTYRREESIPDSLLLEEVLPIALSVRYPKCEFIIQMAKSLKITTFY